MILAVGRIVTNGRVVDGPCYVTVQVCRARMAPRRAS
jgi:hypothetical protein